MSAFKYVSQTAGLRYLSTWALRITPPDQFNDPFELRPRFTALTPEGLRRQAPQAIRDELQKMLPQVLAEAGVAVVDPVMVELFVGYLLRELDKDREATFSNRVVDFGGAIALDQFEAFRKVVGEQIALSFGNADRLLPMLNRHVESTLHSTLQRLVGILCLCRSGKNLLMWSHYTDSHQGALLEFDHGHKTFRRRRSSSDEFGFLRRVSYSETRPELSSQNEEEDAFIHLALTKGLEWSYEQEIRLLLPLDNADRALDTKSGKIHLIDVPSAALKSITFGCRASEFFVAEALKALNAEAAASHVVLKRSVVDDAQYALNYVELR
ncbi:MAG: DUF2971 domain-containing protein [Burkholderiaceae bacterium]